MLNIRGARVVIIESEKNHDTLNAINHMVIIRGWNNGICILSKKMLEIQN